MGYLALSMERRSTRNSLTLPANLSTFHLLHFTFLVGPAGCCVCVTNSLDLIGRASMQVVRESLLAATA